MSDSTTFESHGYTIDLDRLYRSMFEQATLDDNGDLAFHGNSADVRAVKRLLHDLFDVPVADVVHPVNRAVRNEVRDRLRDLGWAVKDPGRSARYVLFRNL